MHTSHSPPPHAVRIPLLIAGIFAFEALTLPCGARAQRPARIHGTVLDDASGKPVAAALVTLEGTALSAETTERGRFVLPVAGDEVHTIVVQRIGYEPRRERIRLGEGVGVDVVIRVSTKAVELEPIEVTVRSGRLAEVGYYDRRD
ncbi:MAG: carboxypeptidase-like regulatory domain-containing protein, partial [Gemmatimonadota bacterium]